MPLPQYQGRDVAVGWPRQTQEGSCRVPRRNNVRALGAVVVVAVVGLIAWWEGCQGPLIVFSWQFIRGLECPDRARAASRPCGDVVTGCEFRKEMDADVYVM